MIVWPRKPVVPKSKGKNYAVGYGRPPRSGRFKKGQSGNPKGRRKGSQSFADSVVEALAEKVTINENGLRRIITRRQALVKQVANKGASGDLNFIKLLVGILERVDEQERVRKSEIVRNENT